MKMALLLGMLVLASGPAWAISDPSEALPDPAQEARAVQIGRELRCLVCQNESIEESGADLARDLRRIVRQQVATGRTDGQVVSWMVARYGNFVRLSPPVTPLTIFAWGSPAIAVAVGAGVVLASRRRAAVAPAPLDAAERARLERLLDQ
jgi:cytochrome c-type biogenesis protein CcmH